MPTGLADEPSTAADGAIRSTDSKTMTKANATTGRQTSAAWSRSLPEGERTRADLPGATVLPGTGRSASCPSIVASLRHSRLRRRPYHVGRVVPDSAYIFGRARASELSERSVARELARASIDRGDPTGRLEKLYVLLEAESPIRGCPSGP